MSFPTYLTILGGKEEGVTLLCLYMILDMHLPPPPLSVVNLEVYVCRKGHCLYPCFARFYSNIPKVATLVSILDNWYLHKFLSSPLWSKIML